MARQTWLKVTGTWLPVLTWVKVAGTWVAGAIPYRKYGADWKQCGETPSLSLSMVNKYYGWDGTSCAGAISVTSNSLWYCVLDSETHFTYGNTGAYGDGTTAPTCAGLNETLDDFETHLHFYIGTTLIATCTLTQYGNGQDCM